MILNVSKSIIEWWHEDGMNNFINENMADDEMNNFINEDMPDGDEQFINDGNLLLWLSNLLMNIFNWLITDESTWKILVL